ncbi:hypothetical protein HRbin23_00729 [bacterium HR23]|nr:hypothetical protein HRbin23_00729 [bacterium HR23]
MQVPLHLLTQLAFHLLALKGVLAQHYHLTLREVQVLGVLAMVGEAVLTQLHRRTAIPKSALTSLVDRLCARSLVERRQDRQDRRRWWLCLTPQGQRLVERLQQEEANLLAPLLEGLSEEERRALQRALEAMTLRLAQAQPGRGRHVSGGLPGK